MIAGHGEDRGAKAVEESLRRAILAGPRAHGEVAADGDEVGRVVEAEVGVEQTEVCGEGGEVVGAGAERARVIVDGLDPVAFARIRHLTVGAFRDWLLGDDAHGQALAAIAPGVTPEMAAAVSKIMRIQDLVLVARDATGARDWQKLLGDLRGALRQAGVPDAGEPAPSPTSEPVP